MAIGPSAAVAKPLRELFQGGTVGGLSDGQLLERFVEGRDQAAFGALVERHGPMVLRVCRHRLRHAQDAEDAFQATFLVLSRRASSIRSSEAIAGWLYGVAGRVSSRVTAERRRRLRAERIAGIAPDLRYEPPPTESWHELHEAIDGLSEKYRLPLLLCYLEGLTYEQAAARLQCPVRTIQTRLARGRDRLRRKLERCGLAPAIALPEPTALPTPERSILASSLRDATVAGALRFSSGGRPAAGLSPAAGLAGEVLRMMFLARIPAVVLLMVVSAAPLAWLSWTGKGAPPTTAPRQAASPAHSGGRAAQAPVDPTKKESPYRMTGTVRVEGTGEPVAGARVKVDLGTKDMRGEFREAVTDAQGRYSIALPRGNARPLFFDPPPGYWLPEPARHWKHFALTPEQPVHVEDYELRRGTPWTIRIVRGPKHEPVTAGFVVAYHVLGDASVSIQERTDARGFATVTLPDQEAKLTLAVMSGAMDDGRRLVKIEQGLHFRPDVVKSIQSIEGGAEPRFRVTDEEGNAAVVAGADAVVRQSGKLVVEAALPDLDPGAFGQIAGKVLDRNDRPIVGATVTLYYQNPDGSGQISSREDHTVRTDERGDFILRNVPRKSDGGGEFRPTVVVYRSGYAGMDTGPFAFRPGADGVQSVGPIRLDPGVTLKGRVVDPDGRPIVGASIEVFQGWAQAANSYRSGPDGGFAIPDLKLGTARVNFTFGGQFANRSLVAIHRDEPVVVRLQPTGKRPAPAGFRGPAALTLRPGKVAPNWIVAGWTDGRSRSIGGLRGRVVVLNFWDMESAERMLPAFERLRRKYEGRGVVFLAIYPPESQTDQIRRLHELKQADLPSALDATSVGAPGPGMTGRMYGIRGFPQDFIIDRSGKVAFASSDPANRGAMMEAARRVGIKDAEKPTEKQMTALIETFLGESIEKALAQP